MVCQPPENHSQTNQEITSSPYFQVVSLVSGSDGGVQFLRSLDGTTTFQNQQQSTTTTNMSQAQTFILPITMPGDKPGDAQQTVQIQVLNPNQIQQAPKFQNFPMQMQGLQGFQQPTVLTVAVPQESEMLPNHGLPEGVTVLAAIQPQDLQLFAQPQQNMQHQSGNTHMDNGGLIPKTENDKYVDLSDSIISTRKPNLMSKTNIFLAER